MEGHKCEYALFYQDSTSAFWIKNPVVGPKENKLSNRDKLLRHPKGILGFIL